MQAFKKPTYRKSYVKYVKLFMFMQPRKQRSQVYSQAKITYPSRLAITQSMRNTCSNHRNKDPSREWADGVTLPSLPAKCSCYTSQWEHMKPMLQGGKYPGCQWQQYSVRRWASPYILGYTYIQASVCVCVCVCVSATDSITVSVCVYLNIFQIHW